MTTPKPYERKTAAVRPGALIVPRTAGELFWSLSLREHRVLAASLFALYCCVVVAASVLFVLG